jgi:hypothetical protein
MAMAVPARNWGLRQRVLSSCAAFPDVRNDGDVTRVGAMIDGVPRPVASSSCTRPTRTSVERFGQDAVRTDSARLLFVHRIRTHRKQQNRQ